MKISALITILLIGISTYAKHFYTILDIPEFSQSQNERLVEFDIEFFLFKENISIKKHNKTVSDLVDSHGDNWKTKLIKRLGNLDEKTDRFFKYLFSSGGINSTKNRSVSVTYNRLGMITCLTTTQKLPGEQAAMVHRRITTVTYDESGKVLEKDQREIRGSGCCFTANTNVMLKDGSEKPINKIKPGDWIKSWNLFTDRFEDALVKETAAVKHENLFQLNFDGFSITTTADHPFWLKKGWGAMVPALADRYIKGQTCNQIDLNSSFSAIHNNVRVFLKLKSIERVPAEHMTYTITTLDRGATFIANGLIVGIENTVSD